MCLSLLVGYIHQIFTYIIAIKSWTFPAKLLSDEYLIDEKSTSICIGNGLVADGNKPLLKTSDDKDLQHQLTSLRHNALMAQNCTKRRDHLH